MVPVYGFFKEVRLPFDRAVETVSEALKKEGFSILTTIDLQAKFKEKLGIDFPKYLILGACEPVNAHQAILAEANIGLMMPCNVILYEKGDRVGVAIVKPTVTTDISKNAKLRRITAIVEEKLERVFQAVK